MSLWDRFRKRKPKEIVEPEKPKNLTAEEMRELIVDSYRRKERQQEHYCDKGFQLIVRKIADNDMQFLGEGKIYVRFRLVELSARYDPFVYEFADLPLLIAKRFNDIGIKTTFSENANVFIFDVKDLEKLSDEQT